MSQSNVNEEPIENKDNEEKTIVEEEESEEEAEPIISDDELEISDTNKVAYSGKTLSELVSTNKNIQRVLKLPLITLRNQEVYYSFSEKNRERCLKLIENILHDYNSYAEYATHMFGCIKLEETMISEAISCFEKALDLNKENLKYLVNLGRIHYLSGNHKQALTYFSKAIKKSPKYWKTYYWTALTIYYMKKRTPEACSSAIDIMLECPTASRHTEILSLIAFLCREKGDYYSASEALKKATDIDSSNIELLKDLGFDYISQGSEELAFTALGKALTYNNFHTPSLLGAAYIIQNNGDFDVALTKYRFATNSCNYSGMVWNNIGMCYYGKGKYIAAISCLKKADYLTPQNWEILFNMGLAYNGLTQYASAYQYISAALNLQPKNPFIFESLAVVLTNLEDFDNARKAYKRAILMDKSKTAGFRLNFAIFEYKRKKHEESKLLLNEYQKLIEEGSKVDLVSTFISKHKVLLIKNYFRRLPTWQVDFVNY
uniref:TPR_REGION domain-containing protein n=1 Tax=Parastrongyloides trichosuri TaxID=131310 RepID=A0A0N4Z9K1_PARTI